MGTMLDPHSVVPQWVADLRQGGMVDANEAALKFWRMTREQFLSSGFDQFIHPEEMARWRNYIAAGTWGESGPWKCLRGDGSPFYCTTRWHMIRYDGRDCAFVFPVSAGETPSTVKRLEYKPQRGAAE